MVARVRKADVERLETVDVMVELGIVMTRLRFSQVRSRSMVRDEAWQGVRLTVPETHDA